MIYATALVMPRVITSNLRDWIDKRASNINMQINWVDVSKDASLYCQTIKDQKNVIAWNCRVPQDWMKRNGRNVLYIENSLISQPSGIFVDTGGFFSASNLHTQQTWRDNHQYALEWIAKKWFNWKYGDPCNYSGPILVALQNRQDCNIRTEFPLAAHADDKVVEALNILSKYLPSTRPVIIRPHPSERNSFGKPVCWQPNWTIDDSTPFNQRIIGCSALVTVNSTCANEASLLSIPVAVLGTGAFTNSNAFLDCSINPENLCNLFDSPDMKYRRYYAAAILSRHFLPYDLKSPRRCIEFDNWINNCIKDA